MPTVPLTQGQVADPFSTRVAGKDQSRLPQGQPKPSFTDLAMAAATMHQHGRLFAPEPTDAKD